MWSIDLLARRAAGFGARARLGERAHHVREQARAQVAALLAPGHAQRLLGGALAQHVELGVAAVRPALGDAQRADPVLPAALEILEPIAHLVRVRAIGILREVAARVHGRLGRTGRALAPRQLDEPDRKQRRALDPPRQVEQVVGEAEHAAVGPRGERAEQHPARRAPALGGARAHECAVGIADRVEEQRLRVARHRRLRMRPRALRASPASPRRRPRGRARPRAGTALRRRAARRATVRPTPLAPPSAASTGTRSRASDLGIARAAVLHRVRERAAVVRDPRLGLLAEIARLLAVDVAARAPRVEPRGIGQAVGERVLGALERAVRLRLAPGRLIFVDLGRELCDLGRVRVFADETLPVHERLAALERQRVFADEVDRIMRERAAERERQQRGGEDRAARGLRHRVEQPRERDVARLVDPLASRARADRPRASARAARATRRRDRRARRAGARWRRARRGPGRAPRRPLRSPPARAPSAARRGAARARRPRARRARASRDPGRPRAWRPRGRPRRGRAHPARSPRDGAASPIGGPSGSAAGVAHASALAASRIGSARAASRAQRAEVRAKSISHGVNRSRSTDSANARNASSRRAASIFSGAPSRDATIS